MEQQQRASQRHEQQVTQNDELLEDFAQIKKNLRISLSGKERVPVQNQDGDWEIRIEDHKDQALCNDKAVNNIISIIEAVSNKNMAGSYISDREYNNMGKRMIKTVGRQIYEKHDEWDIDSVADAFQILDIVDAQLRASLSKGRDGAYMDYRGTVRTESQQTVQREDANNEGGLF